MRGTNLPGQHRGAHRVLASAALALAILLWLGPLSSEAITPVDAREVATLPCLNKSGSAYKARIAPRRCAHFGHDGGFGDGVDLRGLSWDDWGKKTAEAAGTECGFKKECTQEPVHATAYRRRFRCGRRVYTRLSARSTLGTTTVKTRACLGPA